MKNRNAIIIWEIPTYPYDSEFVVDASESSNVEDLNVETESIGSDAVEDNSVNIDGKQIYVAGDTDNTKEAQNVKCDIAFVPVGGIYTMNAKEAAELIKEMI